MAETIPKHVVDDLQRSWADSVEALHNRIEPLLKRAMKAEALNAANAAELADYGETVRDLRRECGRLRMALWKLVAHDKAQDEREGLPGCAELQAAEELLKEEDKEMPFPRTDTGLAEAGYEFKNKSRCKGCNAEIEWWTTPKGKVIPLDPGTLEPHWAACPNAKEFRKK